MRVRLPALGMPILVKELVEQSARRRTYIVRGVYAGAVGYLDGQAVRATPRRRDRDFILALAAELARPDAQPVHPLAGLFPIVSRDRIGRERRCRLV